MNNNTKTDEQKDVEKGIKKRKRGDSSGKDKKKRRTEERIEVQPVTVAPEDPLSRVNDVLSRAMKHILVTDDLEIILQSMEMTHGDICIPKERYINFLRNK